MWAAVLYRIYKLELKTRDCIIQYNMDANVVNIARDLNACKHSYFIENPKDIKSFWLRKSNEKFMQIRRILYHIYTVQCHGTDFFCLSFVNYYI